jgi:hypothetical protein
LEKGYKVSVSSLSILFVGFETRATLENNILDSIHALHFDNNNIFTKKDSNLVHKKTKVQGEKNPAVEMGP